MGEELEEHLLTILMKKTGLSRSQIVDLVDSFVSIIYEATKKGITAKGITEIFRQETLKLQETLEQFREQFIEQLSKKKAEVND